MYTTPKLKRFTSLIAVIALMFFSSFANAFEGDAKNGRKLFKQNCASCHKLDKKLIGPALSGVTERYSEDWLLKWIRNNAELRASGDEDAIAIFEEYNGSVMSAFPALSDQDIFDILQYTVDGDPKPIPTPGNLSEVAVAPSKDYSKQIIIGLGLLLFLIKSFALITVL